MSEVNKIIGKLEDIKTMTGRMGQYETDMINSVIEDLQKLDIYSLKDMEIAFYQGSRILSENNSLDYLTNYKAFMQRHYHIHP